MKNNKKAYSVLIATYNGSEYLEKQILSILDELQDSKIYCSDDYSSDDSVKIISSFVKKNKRVELLNSSLKFGSARANFNYLLCNTHSDYYFLSDQDDVWIHGRAKKLIKKMTEAEEMFGKQVPIVICSDVKVVNKDLEVIADSFWKYCKLFPSKNKNFNRMLIQNFAPGCGMLINKPLVDLATPIPDTAIMHDWWLMLVAAAFGHIGIVEDSTLLYRQHAANHIGVKNISLLEVLFKLRKIKRIAQNRLFCCYTQAEAFKKRYGKTLNNNNLLLLNNFIEMFDSGFFRKRHLMIENKFLKGDILKNIGMFLFL